MRGQVLQLYQPVKICTEECYKCGVIFGLTDYFRGERLQDQATFYCPNGHGQSYRGETDAQKNARLLKEEQARHQRTLERENAERAEKEKLERKLKRVGRGVCPDCNRMFQNLARHMACKHSK